ncbi:hypothetical protein [Methylobacterium sp. J-070]|uniref:hypothetical protein n=1 Tax=Methylobacterium sp. J-070 TaxID=2836650 RepID=UPI001FB929D1|nr:hypothetical protein [Methylobacterium sp. J-070]MCJ2048478.1 hypothetical protein [Methylobacterium sp. J-070]
MEHYKSTLATAAVAAFGLVAAARILHPGNYEDLPRQVRTPAMIAEAPSGTVAWVNPPARTIAVSSLSNAVITTAQAAEVGPTQAARPTAAIVADATSARPEVQPAQSSTEQVQKLVAPPRHKITQRRTRVHQASLTRSAPNKPAVEELSSAPEAPPKTSDRFDPIGSLIHGLGLDS